MEVLTGMEGVLVLATAIGVFVAMIMEVIKRTYAAAAKGKIINPNLIPLLAIVVGIVVGVLVDPFTSMDLVNRIWAGGISGFMASGIYETVKQTSKI